MKLDRNAVEGDTSFQGVLYGIGVGPGDPELMTLKAIRIIRESDVIAVPISKKKGEGSLAYQIARRAYPDIEKKEKLQIYFPMTKDANILDEAHQKGMEQVIECLKEKKKVGFLTLGDPAVYSTYMYLHKRIILEGFQAEIISGIPSFCAAAAALGISLGENNEPIHIIPAAYGIKEAENMKGTGIFMKAGKQMKDVKARLSGTQKTVYGVENCGMENERIYKDLAQIPDDAGYYSMVILKDRH